MALLVVLVAAALAFANGANDNFKGFATVWGAHALTYRRAVALASVAALAGGAVSALLAETLARAFSGKGLVDDAIVADPGFVFAAGGGAAAAVLAATRLGLPVSTTHALIGGLVGAGLGLGGAIDLAPLASIFLLPLLLSPVVAAVLGWLGWLLLRRSAPARDCVCVAVDRRVDAQGAAIGAQRASFVVDTPAACDTLDAPVRYSASAVRDAAHLVSATTVCFARAVNDTPKLAALMIAAGAFDRHLSFSAAAVVMTLGGLMLARRVADTMSHRIARIDALSGLAANLITAALVLSASAFGLPVSTTHVSVGAIAGAGARAIDWPVLRGVVLSWLATLPLAAGAAWALAAAV